MTFDNGGEFARHTPLRSLLAYGTYFCDAYASWQKGEVENTNGRLRRCLPRGIDLNDLYDQDCQDIALTLNTTPRKYLAYRTTIEAFLTELGKDVTSRFA
jgi:IS30 family transposase